MAASSPSQLELDVLAAIEVLDALASASSLDAEIRAAAAGAGDPPSSPRRPSSAGSAGAASPGQSNAPPLNRDDLDACAAVAFSFETTAGAGITAGLGRALVLAKVEGQRGWWSAPLLCRVASVGAGVALGGRRCATLALLGAEELARLAAGSRVRLRAGASLCLAVPMAAARAPLAATAAGERRRKGFSPRLYRSTDLGFDLVGSSGAPDYRISRGVMADFSLRLSALVPCDKLTRAALGGELASSAKEKKIDRGALLSGATPAPVAIRPLARRLNLAAGLAARPSAPWPGVSK